MCSKANLTSFSDLFSLQHVLGTWAVLILTNKIWGGGEGGLHTSIGDPRL